MKIQVHTWVTAWFIPSSLTAQYRHNMPSEVCCTVQSHMVGASYRKCCNKFWSLYSGVTILSKSTIYRLMKSRKTKDSGSNGASHFWIEFVFSFFQHAILTCQWYSQLSELCHIFKGFISYLHVVILSCILFRTHEHTLMVYFHVSKKLESGIGSW